MFDSYGDETTVVKIHSGHGEHEEMDARAIACFDEALVDVGLAAMQRSDKYSTITSLGRPPQRWPAFIDQRMTCRAGSTSPVGLGTDSRDEG